MQGIDDRYRSIIVTGARGWLGRRLVRALRSGPPMGARATASRLPITCLVAPGEATRALLDLGASVVAGDLRDPAACEALLASGEGSLVLHTAGVIHPRRWTKDFEAINHRGTAILLAAAQAVGARRLVAMSSNSPLGANPRSDHCFNEESPYNPYMGYGRSKWRMELALRRAIAHGVAPEITIIRAPWFYGPGQPRRQTLFFTMIKEGRFPLVGDGRNRRSMVYVDSLALGLLLAAACPGAAGRTYWLADARPYAMREIIDTARAVLRDDFGMRVKERTLVLPSLVGDAAEVFDGALQALGFYHQKIHVLSEMNKTIACDVSRARRELGYEPLCELREGMRASVAWCLDRGIAI